MQRLSSPRLPAALLALLVAACAPAGERGAPADFAAHIQDLEVRIGGKIGVYALNTGTGESREWRSEERFATASTFKPLLVAAVLERVDSGELSLDDHVGVQGIQIQPHSPVVGALEPGDTITIGELCEAAVTISDNTATNLLFDLVGGPAGLTQYLRKLGDGQTRMDRYEVALNTNLPDDPRDTTTPRAIAEDFERLLLGRALGAESRQRLISWLTGSRTGLRRLRAGLPAGWRAGDKTGFGQNGAVNNVAIAWPPEGPPMVIAVYMTGTTRDVTTLNAIHASIASLAVQQLYDQARQSEEVS